MNIIGRTYSNRGMAFPVIMVIIIFVAMSGAMFHSLVRQRSHEVVMSWEQARAELAVKAALDLSLLKIRENLNPDNPDAIASECYLDENSWYFLTRLPRTSDSSGNLDDSVYAGPFQLNSSEIDLDDYLQQTDEILTVDVQVTLNDMRSLPGTTGHANPDVYTSSPRMGNLLSSFLSGTFNPSLTYIRPDMSTLDFTTSWWGRIVNIAQGASRLNDLSALRNWLENNAFGSGRPPVEQMNIAGVVRMPKVRDYYPSAFGLDPSHDDAILPGQHLEKTGILRISASCSFESRKNHHVKVSRAGIAEREFRTADAQAVAPAYSLFVMNSGDNVVDLNGGFPEHYQTFINSMPLNEMRAYFNGTYGNVLREHSPFPGSIRINGTNPVNVRIPGQGRGILGNEGNNWLLACAFPSEAPRLRRTSYWYFAGPLGATMQLRAYSRFRNGDENTVLNSQLFWWLPWVKMDDIMLNSWSMPYLSLSNRFSSGNNGGAISKTANYCRTNRLNTSFVISDVNFTSDRVSTHLFGYGGLSATLGREIEGPVYKSYTRMHMGFTTHFRTKNWLGWMGLPTGELPWWSTIIPIRLPMWWTALFEKSGDSTGYDPLQLLETKYGYPPGYGTNPENRWIAANPDAPEIFRPEIATSRPRNIYHPDGYNAKAGHHYESQEEFWADVPARTDLNGRFILDGWSFIDDDLQITAANIPGGLRVYGKGGLIVNGDVWITQDIVQEENVSVGSNTLFSIVQLPFPQNGSSADRFVMAHGTSVNIEASLVAQKLYLTPGTRFRIQGNLVVDDFNRDSGWSNFDSTLIVDYKSHNTSASQASLRLLEGRFDTRRYHVSLSPGWIRMRIQERL